MDDPVLTARELVRNRFPAAQATFLAGSVLTDRWTPTSDLDIVVLLDGPPAPTGRICCTAAGQWNCSCKPRPPGAASPTRRPRSGVRRCSPCAPAACSW
ncbi:nucleotidyltransferase domain-containing protein [Streptomyces sp. NPDC052496]|uniref:nucleotidyltransferase domain-containing protein n=1 Tax=Streptomyces sp. NPDC052496 TaxID=3154951 RepID=UPI00342DD264